MTIPYERQYPNDPARYIVDVKKALKKVKDGLSDMQSGLLAFIDNADPSTVWAPYRVDSMESLLGYVEDSIGEAEDADLAHGPDMDEITAGIPDGD